jgi:hypothetical protein
VVDDQGAGLQAVDRPLLTEHDLLDVGGVGHTDKDDVARLAQADRVDGHVADQVDGFLRGPIPDRQVVPGHQQVGRHAVAHGAEPDETEAGHGRGL